MYGIQASMDNRCYIATNSRICFHCGKYPCSKLIRGDGSWSPFPLIVSWHSYSPLTDCIAQPNLTNVALYFWYNVLLPKIHLYLFAAFLWPLRLVWLLVLGLNQCVIKVFGVGYVLSLDSFIFWWYMAFVISLFHQYTFVSLVCIEGAGISFNQMCCSTFWSSLQGTTLYV